MKEPLFTFLYYLFIGDSRSTIEIIRYGICIIFRPQVYVTNYIFLRDKLFLITFHLANRLVKILVDCFAPWTFQYRIFLVNV